MDTGLRTKAENSNGKLQTDNGHPPAEVRLKKPQAHSSLRHLQCKEAIRRFKGAEKTTGRKDENVFVQNIEVYYSVYHPSYTENLILLFSRLPKN